MKYMVVIGYLSLLSAWDVKEKKVPFWMLILGTVCGGMCWLTTIERGNWQWGVAAMCAAILPGLFMIGIAKLTGKAGAGDGWTLINIGLVESYRICVFCLGISLVVMAVCSGILLLLHKVHKNTKLPYLPFLTMAYLCQFLM